MLNKLVLMFIINLATFTVQAEIVRFMKVSDKLYRGSQPVTYEDYEKLKELGIKTIINLRWDKSIEKSKQMSESLGFNYINVALHGDARPTEKDVQKILREINKKSNGEVFLHCTHGKDRTGLIAALYRVREQGWSPEDAKKEWIKMGFAVKVLHGLKSYFEDHSLSVESNRPAMCSSLF